MPDKSAEKFARVVEKDNFNYGKSWDVCVGRTVLWTFKDSDRAKDFSRKVNHALETSLDIQRQEFEKLNIEQANRIVELEKVNRKLVASIIQDAKDRAEAYNAGNTSWEDFVGWAGKEALAEERP